MLFKPGTFYTDEEVNIIGDRIQKELIEKHEYDCKYVILTYCDILEACFSEKEKELNKETFHRLRAQFEEDDR